MLRRFYPTEENQAENKVDKIVDEKLICEVPVQVVEAKSES